MNLQTPSAFCIAHLLLPHLVLAQTADVRAFPFEAKHFLHSADAPELKLAGGQGVDLACGPLVREPGTRLALQVQARADSDTFGGNNFFLRIRVNGRLLAPTGESEPGLLRQLDRAERYHLEGSASRAREWFRGGATNAWVLPYAKDYTIANQPGHQNHVVEPLDATLWHFDISDLAHADKGNVIRIESGGEAVEAALKREVPVFVRRVAVGAVKETDIFGYQPGESLVVSASPLPSRKSVVVSATLMRSDGLPADARCDLTVRSGQWSREQAIPELIQRTRVSHPVDLTDGPAGDYVAAVRLLSDDEVLAEKEVAFTMPAPPAWATAKAGVTEEPLPPWTPIVTAAKEWQCWGREHRLGPGCLPEQILSASAPLLAAPIQLVAAVAGDEATLDLGTPTQTKAASGYVEGQSQATTAIGRVSMQARMEYDGFLRYDLTIEPNGRPVEGLTLDIPIRKEAARLGHYNRASWLSDSSFAIQGEGFAWAKPFQPCVWVGDEHRGITLYAESPEGRVLLRPGETMSIRSEADAVHLRTNFVDHAVTWREPVTFTFCLQATPVKPYPEGYRDWHIAHWRGGDNAGERRDYPMDVEGAAAMGVHAVCIHSYWAEYFSYPEAHDKAGFRDFVTRCHGAGIKVIPYFSLTGLGGHSPEFQTYGAEWALTPGWKWGWGRGYLRTSQYANSVCTASGWADFIANGIQYLIDEYDIDGVYLDNSGIYPCNNHLHGCGYVDSSGAEAAAPRGGGFLVDWGEASADYTPRFPIFTNRELHKRLYALFKAKGKETIISRHASGSVFPASFAFTDTFWSGEQFTHAEEGYIIPLDRFRTEFIGNQWGIVPEFLAYAKGPITMDMGHAIGLVHDVLSRPYLGFDGQANENGMLGKAAEIWRLYSEFGVEQSRFLGYWEPDCPVRATPEQVKASVHVHPDHRALVVISNLGDGDATYTVTLDAQALGLDPTRLRARDARTKEPVAIEDGRLTGQLPKLGFTIVWVDQR